MSYRCDDYDALNLADALLISDPSDDLFGLENVALPCCSELKLVDNLSIFESF